jgi:ABC-type uncharacterized transport system permease subunit
MTMLGLPIIETSILLGMLGVYLAAAVVGVRQISGGADKYGRLIISLVALGVSLESVILIFRAVEIQDFPLTGLYESMMVLTIALGLTFLFLSIAIKQVWFGSVMVWIIFLMALLSASVAQPAGRLQVAVRTPWIAAHGLAMVLSAAAMAFAAGVAALFLLSRWKLKHKQIAELIGRVPNIERLQGMNISCLRVCLVLLTFGLVSGAGLAMVKSAVLGVSGIEWLMDPKIVLIAAVWLLLAVILVLHRVIPISGKMTAWLTVAASFLILFALVGTAIFCGTKHDFSTGELSRVEGRE